MSFSTIELWLHFALHSLRGLIRAHSPLTVGEDEILARELYSGHVTPGGKINASAFKASVSNAYGLSVNRWGKAPDRLFAALGFASAKRRAEKNKSTVRFKGFAHFQAVDLRKIEDEEITFTAKAALTRTNPFHANIAVPADRDEDYYLLVASEILDKIQPITCLHRA